MKILARIALIGFCSASALLAVRRTGAQELPNLPPLTPAELQMTDNAKQPGALAMILCFAVETDNTKSTEMRSIRIKVFKEEGKKYANVEIPYVEKYNEVQDIVARTIGPDGKMEPFKDQIFDREIVKAKKFRYHAKVLVLPNVQAGSLIEYAYKVHYKEKVPDGFQHPEHYLFERGFTYPAAAWDVQRNLYLKHGHFVLVPVKGARVVDFKRALTTDRQLERLSDGRLQFDIDDVPAFEEEEYAYPEENLKGTMNLYYAVGFFGASSYWAGLGTSWAKEYDAFIGRKKSKAIDAEVSRLLTPKESDEASLTKLYARAQQIRAMDYESSKTGKELKQEHIEENKNAEQVLHHGYGHGNDINLLFIAMARSAGFEANPLLLSSRKYAFFTEEYPNSGQLNALVAIVRAGGKSYLLDPQTRYCPFELLPWSLTGAGGMLVDVVNPRMMNTPEPKSNEAVSRTVGSLKLNEEGTLKGMLTVSYEGQEALSERQWAIGEDELKRREHLEDSMKRLLRMEATVKLLSVDGWEKTGEPLKIEYEIEVPGYATPAGQRLVIPLGVLHTMDKNPFSSPRRTHEVYFEFPTDSFEEIAIELPPGMQAEGLPVNDKVDAGAVTYQLVAKSDASVLRITRSRRIGAYNIGVGQYQVLRKYFENVLAEDSRQVAIRKAGISGAK
jgi:Domain of Unknown Function with PDB structure (DUF3857)